MLSEKLAIGPTAFTLGGRFFVVFFQFGWYSSKYFFFFKFEPLKMARTTRLYNMSDLVFVVVNKHPHKWLDLQYKKSSFIEMSQHWINQIKCDHQYIGSVSYFSLMIESVKQSCSSVDASSNMQKMLNFISQKKNRHFYTWS